MVVAVAPQLVAQAALALITQSRRAARLGRAAAVVALAVLAHHQRAARADCMAAVVVVVGTQATVTVARVRREQSSSLTRRPRNLRQQISQC